jgi:hypothetical protein
MITLLIVNALFIVGLHLATGEDMIFNKPALWVESKVPYWMTKPLFNCPTCMASVHSIVPYWYMTELSIDNACIYVVYVFALAGLSTILARLTE